MHWSRFCSLHFSWTCLAANSILVVPLPYLKPHWFSGKVVSRLVRLTITLTKILPALVRSDIPRWLSQKRLSPLFLQRLIISASLKSCWISHSPQNSLKRRVSSAVSSSPPYLYTSGGMASLPGALPLDICLMAVIVS